MKPPPFRYERPETLEEALTLLKQEGEEARILAGGQSLVPLLVFRMLRPSVLIDIGGLTELEHLSLGAEVLSMGARVTHRDVERIPGLDERCPAITEGVDHIGHVAIRNAGTVGGSIAHADPAAEWPLLALVLDGEFDLQSLDGSRTVSAQEMFLGYMQTAIRPNEMITGIRLRLPTGGSAFIEVARRHGDFAMGGSAAVIAIRDGLVTDARVGVLAAATTPVRSSDAEDILVGHAPTDELFREASEAIDTSIEPFGDVHASAAYKRHLAKVTTFRALSLARQRAREVA